MADETVETVVETKPWWQSKGTWGGLIAIAAGVAGAFGYTITPDDQTWIVEAVVSIATVAGGVLGVYGRIKASKTIK